MKVILIYILNLIFITSLMAQNQYDQFWLLGVGEVLDTPNQSGGTLVDFKTNPPSVSYFHSNAFWGASSCTNICSQNGNPLLYLNGCKVWNFNGNDISHGDSINYPGALWENSCYTTSDGVGYEAHFQGMLMLPFPKDTNKYTIFHLWSDSENWNCRALMASDVDLSKNNGQGQVISKNKMLMLDSLSDGISAVKHGNGRDWWVFNSVLGSDYVYLTKLTPTGLEPTKKVFGLNFWTGSDENGGDVIAQSTFSADGSLFARIDLTPENGFQIAHFDRCAGEFYDPIFIPWKTPVVNPDDFPGEIIGACGVAFSPNNRFLYVSTGLRLYQFDMWSNDIPNSWIMVGEYDGFGILPTTFFLLQNAPDGKIYMNATNSVEYLHVIHNPNEKGVNCMFKNHDFKLLTRNGFSMPNFPNFRLLDLSNSPCDTLGISAINDDFESNESQKLVLSPNPVDDKAKMELPDGRNRRISVFSILGKLVNQFDIQEEQAIFYLDTKLMSVGSYFISIQSQNKPTTTTRMVVVH